MSILDLNNIKGALQIAGKIEFYPQILEMQEKLLEQQKKILDLENENRELKDKLTLKDNIIFERNAYWIAKGSEKDGPFCTKCKDSEDKMVRMRVGKYTFGWANCPNCNKCAA